MESSQATARELYDELRSSGVAVQYPFGLRPAVINVDLQRAYTATGTYATAYAHDEQLQNVNLLSRTARAAGLPVVWTYVAYEETGIDCGIWGTRSDTPDSLQNIGEGSDRASLDPRLDVQTPDDLVLRKRMPSAFFQTPLPSALVHLGTDAVILTGGSTSGCVRATAVDAISHGYATFVIEDAVGDVHESPHYASLYDLAKKYADVRSTHQVVRAIQGLTH